jgi:hypothetical protein
MQYVYVHECKNSIIKKLLHKLYNLQSLPNIITMITLSWKRWSEHVAHMREKCMQSFGRKT